MRDQLGQARHLAVANMRRSATIAIAGRLGSPSAACSSRMARLRRPVADTLRFLARRPKLTLTYSLSDLATVSLTAAVVAGWTAAAAGGFSVRALISCFAYWFRHAAQQAVWC